MGVVEDVENIVWGVADNIVWGVLADNGNIVWGVAQNNDNIVWVWPTTGTLSGVADGSNIVWGVQVADNIVWGVNAQNIVGALPTRTTCSGPLKPDVTDERRHLECDRIRRPRAGDASRRVARKLPVLRSGDVVLREVQVSDAPVLASLLSTSEMTRYISTPPSSVEGY